MCGMRRKRAACARTAAQAQDRASHAEGRPPKARCSLKVVVWRPCGRRGNRCTSCARDLRGPGARAGERSVSEAQKDNPDIFDVNTIPAHRGCDVRRAHEAPEAELAAGDHLLLPVNMPMELVARHVARPRANQASLRLRPCALLSPWRAQLCAIRVPMGRRRGPVTVETAADVPSAHGARPLSPPHAPHSRPQGGRRRAHC